MEPVPIKIVGISATGIKSGNCDKVMEEALKTARSFDHVQTEFITLAEKEIMTCKHCQWCIEQRKPCKYKDDSTWILKEMAEADGMIWGSPVWSHTITPWMINLISRARYSAFLGGELRDKVLGTYVVSWFGVGEEMCSRLTRRHQKLVKVRYFSTRINQAAEDRRRRQLPQLGRNPS